MPRAAAAHFTGYALREPDEDTHFKSQEAQTHFADQLGSRSPQLLREMHENFDPQHRTHGQPNNPDHNPEQPSWLRDHSIVDSTAILAHIKSAMSDCPQEHQREVAAMTAQTMTNPAIRHLTEAAAYYVHTEWGQYKDTLEQAILNGDPDTFHQTLADLATFQERTLAYVPENSSSNSSLSHAATQDQVNQEENQTTHARSDSQHTPAQESDQATEANPDTSHQSQVDLANYQERTADIEWPWKDQNDQREKPSWARRLIDHVHPLVRARNHQ